MKNFSTKQIVFIATLTALAYISLVFFRIPIIPSASFLRFDIKDVFITIGGFLFGPLASLLIAILVSLLSMFTISEYGLIGLAMNVISSTFFATTAALIYKKMGKTTKSAIVGLACGCVLMIISMLLWNYIISPLYMGVSKETILKMLIPVFLPFNLTKSVLNSLITIFIFNKLKKILADKEFLNIVESK